MPFIWSPAVEGRQCPPAPALELPQLAGYVDVLAELLQAISVILLCTII